MSSQQFYIDQIASIQTQITTLNTALINIATSGIASYDLDTGQGKQQVNQLNVSTITATINQLLGLLDTMNAKVYGGTKQVRPQ